MPSVGGRNEITSIHVSIHAVKYHTHRCRHHWPLIRSSSPRSCIQTRLQSPPPNHLRHPSRHRIPRHPNPPHLHPLLFQKAPISQPTNLLSPSQRSQCLSLQHNHLHHRPPLRRLLRLHSPRTGPRIPLLQNRPMAPNRIPLPPLHPPLELHLRHPRLHPIRQHARPLPPARRPPLQPPTHNALT